MTDPRLSTVFDYSNLRLHADGTRVYQKSTNLRPNLVKTVVQDSRSNWIARDAGGSGKVPTHRKIRKQKDAENEDGNAQSNEEEENPSTDDAHSELEDDGDEPTGSGKKRKRKSKSKHQNDEILRAKRQKYINDFDYLAPYISPSTAVASSSSSNNTCLPEPSPDLLNVIHRFSSEFYHERGQLLNISRQYRREKRERTRRRLGSSSGFDDHGTSGSSSDSNSESGGSSDENSSEFERDEDEGEGKDELSSDAEEEETKTASNSNSKARSGTKGNSKGKGKQKAKQKEPASRRGVSRKGIKTKQDDNLYVDMYKMFDGSAMMALGMLVQEQIAQMLNPTMPEAWKDEMKKTYYSQTPDKTKNVTVSQEDPLIDAGKDLDREEHNDDEQEEAAEEDSDNDSASEIGAEAAQPS